jgi:hypothetical protein
MEEVTEVTDDTAELLGAIERLHRAWTIYAYCYWPMEQVQTWQGNLNEETLIELRMAIAGAMTAPRPTSCPAFFVSRGAYDHWIDGVDRLTAAVFTAFDDEISASGLKDDDRIPIGAEVECIGPIPVGVEVEDAVRELVGGPEPRYRNELRVRERVTEGEALH